MATAATAVKQVSKQISPIVTKCISTQRMGVVISAGKNDKAVKVRIAGQEWNKRFRKHFRMHNDYIVSDPNNSCVEGDVVRITSGYRTSKIISHVVTAIIAPFGEPVEKRPPVLSQAQIDELRVKERLLKDVRRAKRGRQVSIARLALAKRQGLRIPTLEEAMEGTRLTEEMLKEKNPEPKEQQKKKKESKANIRAEANKKKKEGAVDAEPEASEMENQDSKDVKPQAA